MLCLFTKATLEVNSKYNMVVSKLFQPSRVHQIKPYKFLWRLHDAIVRFTDFIMQICKGPHGLWQL
jgi:hypothetical protein